MVEEVISSWMMPAGAIWSLLEANLQLKGGTVMPSRKPRKSPGNPRKNPVSTEAVAVDYRSDYVRLGLVKGPHSHCIAET